GKEVAEREGFEPSVGISYARFPGVCLKPLRHLSIAEAIGSLLRTGPNRGQAHFIRHLKVAEATLGATPASERERLTTILSRHTSQGRLGRDAGLSPLRADPASGF